MFGSNYFGFPYFGQGYAVTIPEEEETEETATVRKKFSGILAKPKPNSELFKRLWEEDNEVLAIIHTFIKCR